MAYRRTRRYPEISPSITMDELSRKWSELIRELNARDVEPVPPADIYGRNYNAESVFVTAGTSVPLAPTPAYWHVYEYQIPADAGLVLTEPVSVSASANVQLRTFLPPAEFSEGRTITIAYNTNTQVSGAANFNLAVFARTEVSNSLILKQTGVGGTVNIDASTQTVFSDISGNNVPTGFWLSPVIGSTYYATYAVSAGVSTASINSGVISTTLKNTTTVSAALNLNFDPLTKTFRAFGKQWIQIV